MSQKSNLSNSNTQFQRDGIVRKKYQGPVWVSFVNLTQAKRIEEAVRNHGGPISQSQKE